MKPFLKRITFSFSANSIDFFSRILNQIILVPFFLKVWGAGLYGEYLVITSIPILFFTFYDGFVASWINKFNKDFKENDNLKLIFFKSMCSIIFWSGLILLSILFFFLKVIDLNQIFSIKYLTSKEIYYYIFFLFISNLIHLNLNIYLGVFDFFHKNHLGVSFIAIGNVIVFLLSLIVLYSDRSIIYLGIVNVFVGLLILLVFLKYLWQFNYKPSIDPFRIRYENLTEFLYKGLNISLFNIHDTFFIHGINIIVGFFFGPIMLTILHVHRVFARLISQIFNILNRSLLPEFRNLNMKNSFVEIRRIIKYCLLIINSSAVILLFILLYFLPILIEIFSRSEINHNHNLFILIYILVLLEINISLLSIIYFINNDINKILKILIILSTCAFAFVLIFLTLLKSIYAMYLIFIIFKIISIILIIKSILKTKKYSILIFGI